MATVTGFAARDGRSVHVWTTLGLLVLAVTLSGLAVAALVRIAWGDVAAHLEARDWPIVQAQVLAVSLDRRTSQDGGGARQYLALAAVYAYEVDGTRYEGSRGGLRDTGDLHDRHLQALYGRLNFARLTGRAVAIAYDPAAPERAFVDASLDWWPVAARLALALFLLAAASSSAAAAVRSPPEEG